MKKLVFSFKCGDGTKFRYGRLSLQEDGKEIESFVTTSSIRNKQGKFAWRSKGGLIPPRTPPNTWKVNTTPLNMKHVKGVEGNFYQITPFSVVCSNGVVRGDFGIHRDANVQGSLGCPVMPADHFAKFEKQMKKLSLSGVKSIELHIEYS
jgi:hypothetical protein